MGLEPDVPGLNTDAVKNILKDTRTSKIVGGDE
jgi:hypothetical protein